MKLLITSILMLFLISVPVYADDFQEGMDAYLWSDYKTAFEKWKPLAEQGVAGVQYNIGQLYGNGQGVKQNYKEQVKWYRKAAEQGIVLAQFNLGTLYREGKRVSQDYKEALKWFQLAAEQGSVYAQHSLGGMYYQGKGVPQDVVSAYMWLSIASSKGFDDAVTSKNKIEKEMSPSQIELAEDMTKQWRWSDDFRGVREGERALFGGKYKLAYEKLKPEAEKGNAMAQYRLGQMYHLGYGFTKNDQEAIKWFTKSAQLGNEDSQYEMGVLFSDKNNKNYKLAARYFREAAENKHFLAQYQLGTMYREGKGVIQDYVQAHMWFNIAMAEEKNVDSTRKSTNEIEKK